MEHWLVARLRSRGSQPCLLICYDTEHIGKVMQSEWEEPRLLAEREFDCEPKSLTTQKGQPQSAALSASEFDAI
jgi:hypothetical protein